MAAKSRDDDPIPRMRKMQLSGSALELSLHCPRSIRDKTSRRRGRDKSDAKCYTGEWAS